jgi:hypothetical protein
MNAYTAMGQSRIQQRDIWNAVQLHPFEAAAAMSSLEWQRGCQAEAELRSLLKQNGIKPNADASRVSTLRRAIGAALVRAGQRLAGAPWTDIAPDTAATAGTLGTTG